MGPQPVAMAIGNTVGLSILCRNYDGKVINHVINL